jgi:MoxR-like ATPase
MRRVADIRNYIKRGKLWDAFVKARRRPIVVITSNDEKELPDAFLRPVSSTTSAFPIRIR